MSGQIWRRALIYSSEFMVIKGLHQVIKQSNSWDGGEAVILCSTMQYQQGEWTFDQVIMQKLRNQLIQ
jgi:hypothetical protein